MAGTLMPEQIAQQLAGLHLGAPHQQASISPAPGGGIMTVELPGNEGFGICGSCIKVEGLQEQPMITMVTSGGKVVTLDQWWARLASLDLTPEERAAMATAFASGRLAARDVLLAMLVRPRTAVYGMRQIMEAWAAAGCSPTAHPHGVAISPNSSTSTMEAWLCEEMAGDEDGQMVE